MCQKCDKQKAISKALDALRQVDRDFITAELLSLEKGIALSAGLPFTTQGLKSQHDDYTIVLHAANAVVERTLDGPGRLELVAHIILEMAAHREAQGL